MKEVFGPEGIPKLDWTHSVPVMKSNDHEK